MTSLGRAVDLAGARVRIERQAASRRLRVCLPGLRRLPGLARHIEQELQAWPGVQSASGSLADWPDPGALLGLGGGARTWKEGYRAALSMSRVLPTNAAMSMRAGRSTTERGSSETESTTAT